MYDVQLLDCTIRDGGYVNDWEFGHSNLVSVYERLVQADVDMIEIGFLDARRPFDINRSIMPDTESVKKIWGSVSKKAPMTVGMIDYGTCPLENIELCENSFLDGIRVIFKKHIMHEAMDYCAEIKKKGYKVFSQLVSITSYSDEELMELIELVNEVEPYAVSMVDTYGLFQHESLLHYYELLDKYVKPGIQIGFHAHNNLDLAFANALTFLKKERRHSIVVDATLYGMGKSAGNAQIELVADYMNNHMNKMYKIPALLEAIDESIMPIYNKKPWGYKMFFYLCAANKCHPNYVSYFLEKDNLSISSLYELLGRIEPESKKLLYDTDIAEKLYQEYIDEKFADEYSLKQLKHLFGNEELLVIGPGKSVYLQKDRIDSYIKNKNPLIISINYIPNDIKPHWLFVTKGNRYQQLIDMEKEIGDIKILATSNIGARNKAFDIVLQREPLLEKKEEIRDNSFLMLLRVLSRIGIKKIVCAGLDGYSENEDNYANPRMEYHFIKSKAKYLNNHIKTVLETEYKELELEFLTYSHYTEIEDWRNATF